MRKYLVVVRAGEKSLHMKWLGSERNWDLVVSYYGDDPALYVNDEYLRVACKGTKFIGLSDFFRSSVFNWKNYDYIWCPDDDLDASCLGINQFFETCELIGAELAQPAGRVFIRGPSRSGTRHSITAPRISLRLWPLVLAGHFWRPCCRRLWRTAQVGDWNGSGSASWTGR